MRQDKGQGRLGIASRAVRSVARHPMRSALLVGIVALCSCLLLSSFATLSASVRTQSDGSEAASGSYRVELDVGNLRKRMAELPPEYSHVDESGNWWTELPDNAFESVLLADMEKLGEAEGVSAWSMVSVPVPASIPDLQRIEDPDRDQTYDYGGVNVVGARDVSMEQNVVAGNVAISEGRWPEVGDEHVVAISEELARLNGLSVGDVIRFADAKDPEGGSIVTARICGVFEIVHDIPSTMSGDTYRSENTVFSDLDLSQEIAGRLDDPLYSYATFSVADPSNYREVGEALKGTDIDWARYQLVDDSGATERMADNFAGMERSTWVFMAFVAGCGIVLVALSMAFWAKTRRREAGVLLSLGNGRTGVVGQVVAEAIALALAGCLVGCSLAWPVSGAVADSMAGRQAQVEQLSEQASAGQIAGAGDYSEGEYSGIEALPSFGTACGVSIACTATVAMASALAIAPAAIRGPRRLFDEVE